MNILQPEKLSLTICGMGCLLILLGITVSPSFVVDHLSPDGILEESTVKSLQILRIMNICLGLLTISLSILVEQNYMTFHKVSGILKALSELDFSKTRASLVLIFLFILSRLPLLNLGFGLDSDAWRIANSAFDLRYSHIYHTSRFPGYPLPEFINALVIDYRWLATNSLTMILSLSSVIFFARIVKRSNVKNKGLLVLTYAFFPVLWINSTNTMDYMWALTFTIIAWSFLLKKRYCIAGLMIGLAVASRLSSIVFVFPFLYLIWVENKKVKTAVCVCTIAAATSLLWFLPLFLTYGLSFLTYHPGKVTIFDGARRVIECFGLFTLVILSILFLVSLPALSRRIIERDKTSLFLLLPIILVGILFLKVPHEGEYLIPAIPFLLLLLDKICRKELVVLFCIVCLSHAVVSLPISIIGAIPANIEARKQQIISVRNLMAANVEKPSIVIIGARHPILSYLDENLSAKATSKVMGDANSPQKAICNYKKDIIYKYLLPLDELERFQSTGYHIYYIRGIRHTTKNVYGYDLADYNAVLLNTSF